MKRYDIIKTENKNFLRDMNSKALLCNDLTSLQKFKSFKNAGKIKNNEINNLKNEIDDLKDELLELKTLLKEYLSGKE